MTELNRLQDPLIQKYLKTDRKISKCLWYKYRFKNGECIMLLPYRRGEDGFYDWTGDKISFKNLEQAQKFCVEINCELIAEEDEKD